MLAFDDLFDDLFAEGIELARVTRGEDTLVGNDLRFLPIRAGVHGIRFDRLVEGHLGSWANR
jgi:hypothetical protein